MTKTWDERFDEAIAGARMDAASRELYEALERVTAAGGGLEAQLVIPGSEAQQIAALEEWLEAQQAAWRALAKARGEDGDDAAPPVRRASGGGPPGAGRGHAPDGAEGGGMNYVGKKNTYTCEICGYVTVTIDCDDGTTPMIISCKNPDGCNHAAYSAFYRADQNLNAEYEWYRPSKKEAKKADKKHPGMFEHYASGGLFLRRLAS